MEMLVSMFEWHNMTSLREINKVLQDLELLKSSKKQFKVLPFVLLSILRRKYQQHYSNFIKNRVTPYRNSSSSSKLTEHLPTNNAIHRLSINKTHSLSVEIEVALHTTLYSCNDEQSDIPFNELNTLQSMSFNEDIAIKRICTEYTVNSGFELAGFNDYICLLDLVGHYEI
ncbi:hypothetical protein OPW32_22900 [Vibrio europaeus]|uniref:hypothetical protein n=1 Tax=Vibrio europaeus TaxID=300876 RepID=UPI002340206B|nr:hypothetical protein [Vibrio europaeus]MDC5852044.1 hypothetical protein [Vibrio europaeus]